MKLPQLHQITKFNTFKGYARILKLIEKNLNDNQLIIQEKESLSIELGKVRQKLSALRKQKLNCLTNSENSAPSHILGWGIQLKGPYYRLFKKINGKVKWIHIGRQWNTKLAEKKIKAFLEKYIF